MEKNSLHIQGEHSGYDVQVHFGAGESSFLRHPFQRKFAAVFASSRDGRTDGRTTNKNQRFLPSLFAAVVLPILFPSLPTQAGAGTVHKVGHQPDAVPDEVHARSFIAAARTG